MKLGVLGGGQLGRMLALAGYPLGFQFRFYDNFPEAPVEDLAELVVGSYEDKKKLARFAQGLDALTYEFENVPVDCARFLSERLSVFPPPTALEVSQDRFVEKNFFRNLKIPTPNFFQIRSRAALEESIKKLGFPTVLKTRRLGYDGKGQYVIKKKSDIEVAWQALKTQDLILEEFVDFDRELSIVSVRDRQGSIAFYPVVENQHHAGILRLSLAPAPNSDAALQAQAETYARRVLNSLSYVGVLAIEFFQIKNKLLVNEMAPRVHNSGHWTIEGAETSQFENHLRAMAQLPLGSTKPRGYAAMINLIGAVPPIKKLLAPSGVHLHLYNKTPRAGRKLGHITICATTEKERKTQLTELKSQVDFM
jgi:5-(carboxyamino)imidazole ribonucleotide synthase